MFLKKLFDRPLLRSRGHCSTCDSDTTFESRDTWLRDNFFCVKCHSIPRERALMCTIERWYPAWPELTIHESSPIGRGASERLRNGCCDYIPSQWFPDTVPGSIQNGCRCEDLRALTFADESIDLHITQDVLEHVFDPEKVFAEIARTLRPGGAHICTVPLVRKHESSRVRASMDEGQVKHHLPPQYHGNPVSDDGSLVVTDWGFDICRHIFDACGLFTQIVYIDDLSMGIRAEYIEVLVTRKP